METPKPTTETETERETREMVEAFENAPAAAPTAATPAEPTLAEPTKEPPKRQPKPPGIYQMSGKEFSHVDAVSHSALEYLTGGTPLHLYDATMAPDREPRLETDAMRFGRVVHTLVLEPNLIDSQFVLCPDFNRRTKDGKEQYAKFMEMAAKQNLTTLDAEELERAKKIAAAVQAHPRVAKLLKDGHSEQCFVWKDQETGLLLKSKPDHMRNFSNVWVMADLKTTDDAHPAQFNRSVHNYGYYRQAALYIDGMKALTGIDCPYLFIVAEHKRPFAVALYELHPDAITLGRAQYRKALQLYAECKANNNWPGYPTDIARINLPAYAYRS